MENKNFEPNYEQLFENLLDGLAYCRMIFDAEGNPIDFTYLLVNKNFEQLTGLKGVGGKNVTEVIPGVRESNPDLFEIYGRVALSGASERFETYVAPLSRWFLVSAYSPEKNYFVAIFQNITERKETEKELADAHSAVQAALRALQMEHEKLSVRLNELELLNNSMVGRELRMVELKKEIERLNGIIERGRQA
jgi:PAS domain S-box-containing protein